MSQFQFISRSTEETMRIAERLGKKAKAGDLFALDGDLGAGKTHFSKGLAKGLGVEAMVNSPTFTILKVYNGCLPFYHIDAYRLDENEEEELGLEEYMDGNGVTVVEWASNLRTQLPSRRVNITFKRVDEQEREWIVCTDHTRFQHIFKEFTD
ncbi:tRNA (adenosine(37)-N6)-threonylcarbamoyltransferase complex ATPase subunit type 1 TsaE [Salicibibacter cibi]|uniref:tRNA threonylcarbamoyladenosine biosynthesis protein TsaE n=1 Tax=Salicibibacter cibi TaxID=2743001 RepID=A0A7T6Z9A5_9BACI|nr:tRNA (adenosine(37)-N6)-threonylcarbamoyltransferase complex ATPase subunit type 1 TsaE [Salicibibacter cibi]QQK79206.1 tRNA (adenosine(37)-N6)-threonylcarbamoyltransferase complex ATPase subunit type 1 TsaE [Salicibibacter cibi]